MSVRSRQARNNPCCNVVMPVPVSANILCYVRPPVPFHCLYQMHSHAHQQYQQPQQRMEIKQIPDKKNKRAFGFSWNDKNVKNSLIVVVIFILLNSRMIWKAISRIPMMGSVEPSILALIVNSIIAGIVFYIIW